MQSGHASSTSKHTPSHCGDPHVKGRLRDLRQKELDLFTISMTRLESLYLLQFEYTICNPIFLNVPGANMYE